MAGFSAIETPGPTGARSPPSPRAHPPRAPAHHGRREPPPGEPPPRRPRPHRAPLPADHIAAADQEFHMLLLQCSGNAALRLLGATLSQSLHRLMLSMRELIASDRRAQLEMAHAHGRVLDAVVGAASVPGKKWTTTSRSTNASRVASPSAASPQSPTPQRPNRGRRRDSMAAPTANPTGQARHHRPASVRLMFWIFPNRWRLLPQWPEATAWSCGCRRASLPPSRLCRAPRRTSAVAAARAGCA